MPRISVLYHSADFRKFNFTDGGTTFSCKTLPRIGADNISVDKMTKKITASEFKKLCFDIETSSNRQWQVDNIYTDTYPKNFYYATFKDNNLIFACNINAAIFAFVDNGINKGLEYFKTGFIDNNELTETLHVLLRTQNVTYIILESHFANLSFAGQADFNIKTKSINVDESQIKLVVEQLQLDLFNYKLFYGQNVGYNLFHSFDD